MTLFTASSSRRATASVVAGMTLAGAAAVGFSAPAQAASVSTWEQIAECESNNTWDINTGNGFYGGLQFTLTSWQAMGGQGYPHQASKAEQIMRAEKLQDVQGWGAWPVCSAKAGLSGADTAPDAYAAEAAAPAAAPVVERQAAPVAETPAVDTAAADKAAAEQAAAERAAERRAAAAEKAAAAKAASAEKAAAEQAVVAEAETIVVEAGDSLFTLAAEYEIEGGWAALYEANQDTVENPELIYVGQELVLPQA